MYGLRFALAAITALALCACQEGTQAGTYKDSVNRDPSSLTVAKLREIVSDRTNMFYGSSHGTQIEYTSADGRAYLWYPGNNVVLPGFWKIDEAYQSFHRPQGITVLSICFRYGANTYNPATGHQGASWECSSSAIADVSRIADSKQGDLFGLSQRQTPPFVLSTARTTLEDLSRRVGSARQ